MLFTYIAFVAQGREWMQPLKDECNTNLLAKTLSGNQDRWPVPFDCVPFFFESLVQRMDAPGGNGSPMDTLDTQPLEHHGEGPLPCKKPGAIPNIANPDEQTFSKTFHTLWNSPPILWDPRLQHKKPFRDLVKRGGGKI